ncbi:MAG: hypothetical protein GY747_05055 [Planctomycetes bacterium]|nr:hypothetical protein [Planctomycetota bacterium]MCP4770074.1 hypothetical protein [Planctomycetota bacterium]
MELYNYEGTHTFHKYGDGIAAAGDVNLDGIDDYMIGARESTFFSSAITPGSITVYSGADGDELYRIDGTSHNSAFGTVMCAIGDVDGDGASDFVAGDPMYSIGSYTFEGAYWVYSGIDGSVIFWETGTPSSFFGNSIAKVGDLDGDGSTEFAVGAPNENGGGAVHIIAPALRGEVGLLNSPHANANFGVSLSAIGDIDGDSHNDLVVGASRYDCVGANDVGAAYLISIRFGTVLHVYEGWDSLNEFGKTVSSISDLDGDGLDEVVICAPQARQGNSLAIGAVDVYSTGSNHKQIYRLLGNGPNETFGSSVAVFDDQDGDGFDDFLVGVPYRNTNGTPGIAALYSGRTGLLMHRFGNGIHIGFGQHVANLGDIDGDGFGDVGVGTPESLTLFTGTASIYGSRKFLHGSRSEISSSAGGRVDFEMDFDRNSRGFAYRFMASANGTGPTIINGLSVPLGMDSILNSTSTGSYPGFVANGQGMFDGRGNAHCTLLFPPTALNTLIGRRLFFATMAGNSLLAPTIVSEPVSLTVLP